ncbi:hypothetical protein RHMOL_Rhmol12G0217300 [Rhododendron molle]|uniref:Uncharacterized protein n=1 Tax=Rhododendron molle TaxID=49168 RepID=A0ACC0LLS1_RHOML|nr:hypothetical protein RHMOL_Rhmol12G0217300 [Rhododendron molle]
MGDIAVDIFLETLKQLITSSNSDLIIAKKDQLQSLENEIKYLRGFLKITEKKRNEYLKVMELVMQIRDVVSEAENIVELFVSHAFKADVSLADQKKKKADAAPFQNNKKRKQKKKERKKKKKAIRELQDQLSLVDLERDVVSEAENIVELFVSHAFKADASLADQNKKKADASPFQNNKKRKKKKKAIRELQDPLSLVDLESVKMKIKTLAANVKEIYDKNMYDINGVEVKKPKHSSTKSEEDSGKAISVAETKRKRQSVLQLDEQTSILTLPLTQTIKATMCAQEIVASRFVKPSHRLCSAVITVNGGCF